MKCKVWFSPLFLWVALALLLQAQTCARGDTYLLSLELEVDGQDLIQGFNINNRTGYAVTTTSSIATLTVETRMDDSTATYQWFVDGTSIEAGEIGLGGGSVVLNVPSGQSQLYVAVRAAEGNVQGYWVDVDNVANAVAKIIPMYCTVTGYGYGFEGTDFHLSVEALDPVIATQAFQVEISGLVRPILQDQVNFIDVLIPGTPERIAIIGGGISATTRSGATGPDAVLQVASLPTTCAVDANGNSGFGAGPYPACDPANDTGDGGNTDCLGIAGVPINVNPCRPFRELTLIDGTQDACAACDALDSPWLTTGCETSGYCAALSDPWFALEPGLATFTADTAGEALFGFEESLFPTEYPDGTVGFTMLMLIDNDPSQVSSSAGNSLQIPIECFMGVLDGLAQNGGPSPTQVPDSDLVSIAISACTPSGSTCANGILDACEECDDGNLIDGDGCQSDCTVDFCASDPINCSTAGECVVADVCDRLCEPGTGCNRCRGGGPNQPDGSACAGGTGSCLVGACDGDYCLFDPIDCSATTECLTDGVCEPACEPGTGCDRCPGQDLPAADGTLCGGDEGTCQSGVCEIPSWGTAQLIETEDLGEAEQPQVAVDPNGNAIAVWHQFDGDSLRNIWANRYTPGSGWGTPVRIDRIGSTLYAEGPQVAVDPAGNAIAVWVEWDGARWNIWANRYTPSGGWGTPQLIETDDADSAGTNMHVALDPNGNAIAVWHQGDGVRSNMWANRYTPSGGWGTAELIEINDAGDAWQGRVAIDPSGSAIAVWYQYSADTIASVWSNRYTPSGGWGTAELLEVNDAGDAWHGRVAIDTTGDALAVWHQWDGVVYNVWSNRYTSSGGWGGPVLVETHVGTAAFPAIAMDATGNAIVTWHQDPGDGTAWTIWANRYTAGLGWGLPERISRDDFPTAQKPQVAVTPDGDATVVWYQWGIFGVSDIWANQYSQGSGWGVPLPIETDDLGVAVDPQVAVDPDGNAIAVWPQSDGTRHNIWSNRFE